MSRTLRVLFDDSLAGNPAGTGTFVRGVQPALTQLEGIDLAPAGSAGRVHQLDVSRKGPAQRLRNALHRVRYYWQVLPALARASGCDVIYCPAAVGPLRGATPSVMTVFDMTTRLHPETLEPASRIYAQQMLRIGLRRSAAICTISEAVRAELLAQDRLAPDRVVVAHPGPSPDLLAAEPESVFADGRRFLLMVGTLEPRKNHLTALRALHAYRERHPDSTPELVLAGSPGWRYQPVLDEIARLDLGRLVTRVGATSPGRLKWLYQHAIALLFPSLYEGFGLPVLEAMGQGCPVIAARIPPVMEIAGSDTAVLLDPAQVPAWTDAIDQAVSSPRDAARLAAARQRAQRFTWPACAAAVAQAIRLACAV